jgi:hypothetical protein
MTQHARVVNVLFLEQSYSQPLTEFCLCECDAAQVLTADVVDHLTCRRLPVFA